MDRTVVEIDPERADRKLRISIVADGGSGAADRVGYMNRRCSGHDIGARPSIAGTVGNDLREGGQRNAAQQQGQASCHGMLHVYQLEHASHLEMGSPVLLVSPVSLHGSASSAFPTIHR